MLEPLQGEPDPEGADCVSCGRCCHHGPNTVTLLESDEARMTTEQLEQWTHVHDRPPWFRFLRNTGVHCACLNVEIPGQFPCNAYDVRPEGCRVVEPGSPCCMQARALGHLGTSVKFRRADRTE